jgi:hypothetical protein
MEPIVRSHEDLTPEGAAIAELLCSGTLGGGQGGVGADSGRLGPAWRVIG